MRKSLLFSGALWLAVPFFGGCGGFCGDGVTDAELGEACDDGNNDDGDVCSASCTFEPPSTDYRLSSLVLIDDRFGRLNGLIEAAIDTSDLTKAMNIIIHFDSTVRRNANVLFGPGSFIPVDDSFDFVTDLNGDITPTSIRTKIDSGVASFERANLFMPVESELISGVFAPLLIQNVSISANFDHKQLTNLLFKDVLNDTSTLDTKIAVKDLCALNIFIKDDAINLLDVFDDGIPTPPGQQPSSITPLPGTTPDQNNCRPCEGTGSNPRTCTLPEDKGPDNVPKTGDELYNISATFEAEGGVLINPL